MDEQTRRIAQELRDNPALLQRVMRSPDGQALLAALNRDRDGFRTAVRDAAAGDSADLARRLREITRTPGGAALLSRVEQAVNGRNGGV